MSDEKVTDGSDLRLAEAIVARRTARGWKQMDVASRGGLSLDRVQAFESGRIVRSRPSTEVKLELGLEWGLGSLDALRRGERPLPFEEMNPEQVVRYTIKGLAGASEQAIWAKLDERRKQLGLTWKQIVWRADLDRATQLQVCLNRKAAHAVEEGIEGAVQWERGSVQGIVLGNLDPECTTYFHLRPNDDSETVPLGAAGWSDHPDGGFTMARSAMIRALTHPPKSDEKAADYDLFPDLIRLIGSSGLPDRAQIRLAAYMAERRLEMHASMKRDLEALITMLKSVTD